VAGAAFLLDDGVADRRHALHLVGDGAGERGQGQRQGEAQGAGQGADHGVSPHWLIMKVRKSPFSGAVHARPRTEEQLRWTHLATLAGSV